MATSTLRRQCFAVAAAVSILSLGGAANSAPPTDDVGTLLRTLDTEIQKRFLDSSRGFGFSRMLSLPRRHGDLRYRLTPETDGEREAVAGFSARGLAVQLFVARGGFDAGHVGPRVVETSPWRARPALQGPVAIVSGAEEAPAPAALEHDARRALRVLQYEDVLEFTQDGWHGVSRPVRAANAQCVACHNNDPYRPRTADGRLKDYRDGDMLGVLMYLIRGEG
jgi:hypothetical protein